MVYKGNIGPLRYKNCFEAILNENLINWRQLNLVLQICNPRLGRVKRASMKIWDWRTVQHVSVASQNRQLLTSSTAVRYIGHHTNPIGSKLGH